MSPPKVPAPGRSNVSVRNHISTHVREAACLPQWEMFPPTPLSRFSHDLEGVFLQTKKGAMVY